MIGDHSLEFQMPEKLDDPANALVGLVAPDRRLEFEKAFDTTTQIARYETEALLQFAAGQILVAEQIRNDGWLPQEGRTDTLARLATVSSRLATALRRLPPELRLNVGLEMSRPILDPATTWGWQTNNLAELERQLDTLVSAIDRAKQDRLHFGEPHFGNVVFGYAIQTWRRLHGAWPIGNNRDRDSPTWPSRYCVTLVACLESMTQDKDILRKLTGDIYLEVLRSSKKVDMGESEEQKTATDPT